MHSARLPSGEPLDRATRARRAARSISQLAPVGGGTAKLGRALASSGGTACSASDWTERTARADSLSVLKQAAAIASVAYRTRLKAAVWVRSPKNKMSSLCPYIHLNNSSSVSSTADVSKTAHADKVDRWEQQRTAPTLTPSVLLPTLYLYCEFRVLLFPPFCDASAAVSCSRLWNMEQRVGQEEPSTSLS